jgi:hypothetical protein
VVPRKYSGDASSKQLNPHPQDAKQPCHVTNFSNATPVNLFPQALH